VVEVRDEVGVVVVGSTLAVAVDADLLAAARASRTSTLTLTTRLSFPHLVKHWAWPALLYA